MDDVHGLRVFLAVAENLSFTRAAEKLFLTQSAVSHQISSLERELGAALLVRSGRHVALTPAGTALQRQGQKVMEALREATAVAQQAARPEMGRLRIGASSAACQYIIPEALREFRESFPDFQFSIQPGDSPITADRLQNDLIDLGILIRPDRARKLQCHELFTDELGFVVSPLHAWARAGKIDREQISAQRMVLYSRQSTTFRMVDRYLSRIGAPLRDWIELGETGAIKELVKLGLGISIMARWIVAPEIHEKSLVFLPISSGKLRRKWCIAWGSGRRLSVAEQTFVGLCDSVCAEIARGEK